VGYAVYADRPFITSALEKPSRWKGKGDVDTMRGKPKTGVLSGGKNKPLTKAHSDGIVKVKVYLSLCSTN
jgi:hypothetical protein